MFIAIVGTRGSGKSTVQDYLVAKGFTSVRLTWKDLEVSLVQLSRLEPSTGFYLGPT
jgi:adenylate kinase family enzyme